MDGGSLALILCEHVRTKVDKGLNGFVDIIHDYVELGPHHGLASVVDFYQDPVVHQELIIWCLPFSILHALANML